MSARVQGFEEQLRGQTHNVVLEIQEKEHILVAKLRKLEHDTLEAKLSQHVVKHSINYNQHYIRNVTLIRFANIIRSVHFLNNVNVVGCQDVAIQ